MRITPQHYIERFLYLTLLSVFVISSISIIILMNAIHQNQQNLINICQSANELRGTEKKLWDYILQLPPQRVLTPEEKQRQDKVVIEFRIYLDNAFAQRKCE